MISVDQALKIIDDHVVSSNQSLIINVSDALGYVVFEDITSPISMPPFRQSAMDGYALNLHDSFHYTIIDEVKAGDAHQPWLNKGDAVRIFTGAPVPDSADAIIIQERVKLDKQRLTVETQVDIHANIRPFGEQIKKGEVAIKKGTKLTPAAIGFLASLGITDIKVIKKPTISVVVTGNELVPAGHQLGHGQIYESNTSMLVSALTNTGYGKISTHTVNDNYDETVNLLDKVLKKSDLVLVSGGISVGDYDFVGKALVSLGVDQLFYKVKQKPGKPLFFGKKDKSFVFALPGNPAAALSCFYIYVLTTLEKISGHYDYSITTLKAKSTSNYIKKGDRAQFLKAIYNDGDVEILEGQNSSMLHTFTFANAMVYVPENLDSIEENELVDVILLPLI